MSTSKKVKNAKILPLIRFKVFDFINDRDSIISAIKSKFNEEIIVRSSSLSEDNNLVSNAGAFESILNVDTNSKNNIEQSIQKVIKSYGKNLNDLDEVFVQPMLKNVSMSGVIFTSDIDTLSPYYIINYDESGSTDSLLLVTQMN